VPSKTYIGTAGWSIPRAEQRHFPAGVSLLTRYAKVLPAVEINSTFYRPHRAATFERWAASVPRSFRFSVKLPQTITHENGLTKSARLLDTFLADLAPLGTRLGCLLVQLPPSLAFDARIADTFFASLRRRLGAPVACEPRHASWFAPRVDTIWQRYDIARVAADPARLPEAALPGGAGRWRYWRLHGAPRMYYDRYDEASLRALASTLLADVRSRRSIWCIFDNTAAGHAIADAVRLQALLARSGPTD